MFEHVRFLPTHQEHADTGLVGKDYVHITHVFPKVTRTLNHASALNTLTVAVAMTTPIGITILVENRAYTGTQ